ncbi:hypothetical protein [Streptomyces sp. NPDC052225]|uniref:hypothetical protein n=1 Tax=Streptomyces sp. NPDC052225 TaxID=3154949 RepID=UPI003413AE71
MSTPPPPQPGPYGPPHQQPQQPPQAPYGQPQQPYGQPPAYPGFPQQQGGMPYGAPWGAPPPPKKKTGLIIGIVAGVVGVVVVGIGALAFIGSQVEGSFPDAEYKLTLPQKLLGGKYELADDMSDGSEGQQIEDEADGAYNAKDATAVVAQYAPGGDAAKGVLVISGMYGRFKDTDDSRDNMMKGAAESDGAKVVVEPRDFHPAGADTTITCEVLTKNQAGTELTMAMCAWVDDNTGASVGEIDAADLSPDPKSIDLEAAAETAAKVRAEIRKPVG